MDQLENQGIIGPQDGAKPRRIFFPKDNGLPVGEMRMDTDIDDDL